MTDLHIIEITDRKKFIKDAAESGYDYAIDNLRRKYCYEIITTRQKTNHPTKIIVDVNLLMPYLYPFGSYINGERVLSENELEDYIFPIFDKDNDTEDKKFSRMAYMNYLVNVNLKRIARRLGLSDGITFYTARHHLLSYSLKISSLYESLY